MLCCRRSSSCAPSASRTSVPPYCSVLVQALGDIKDWPSGADTVVLNGGGVTNAQDECILHYIRTTGTGNRAVCLDKNNHGSCFLRVRAVISWKLPSLLRVSVGVCWARFTLIVCRGSVGRRLGEQRPRPHQRHLWQADHHGVPARRLGRLWLPRGFRQRVVGQVSAPRFRPRLLLLARCATTVHSPTRKCCSCRPSRGSTHCPCDSLYSRNQTRLWFGWTSGGYGNYQMFRYTPTSATTGTMASVASMPRYVYGMGIDQCTCS